MNNLLELTFNAHERLKLMSPKTNFESGKIVTKTPDGVVFKKHSDSRSVVQEDKMETQWGELHLPYFNAYTTWIYLTIPFILATPGFEVEEVKGLAKNWRALLAKFPAELAYHSREQLFYLGPDGLLRGLDYNVDISKLASSAYHVYN